MKLKLNILKNFILNCIQNVKGQDIVCFNIHAKNSITDIIILCTGRSNRHVISIAQNILKNFRNNTDKKRYGIEGIEYGEWILIDLGEIIIHITKIEVRKLYDLEKLWI